MHVDELEARLTDRLFEGGYFAPTYRDFGVANVPDAIAGVLGAEADERLPATAIAPAVDAGEAPIDHVVMVVVDGFGWNRYRALRGELEPLATLDERARTVPLTSTYPSETAAAMVTLYTGLQPVEHGQLGWFSWYPRVNRVELSLPFETLDGRPLDEALGLGLDDLFDPSARDPVAVRLRDAGATTAFVQPAAVAHSPTSRHVAAGADLIGYEDLSDGFEQVRSAIEADASPSYHQLYYADVDVAAHRHGSQSPEYRTALTAAVRELLAFLDALDATVAERTLVLVVADHGIHDTGPEVDVALDRLDAEGTIDLEAHLRPTEAGEALHPAGSPRNLQLYVRDGHVGALRDELEAALEVRTYDESEYREANLFGDRPPSDQFDARAPDLVVVPGEGGLWYDDGELDVVGMHGGMHPHEMLVPLFALRAG